jgi:predicted DNA-binding protein YlxM (UPF0122 family)
MSAFVLHLPKPKLPIFDPQDCPEEELLELEKLDPRPEAVCYRGQTLAVMRHFFELSCQAGRLPSLLCREFFRAKVTHHAIPSFEEQAVFVRDVELCLERLSDEHAEMIQLIGLYDFSAEEIAAMLRRSRSWVYQRVDEAVDALTEIFLQAGLLKESRPDRRQCQVTSRSLPADVVAAGKKPCASVESSADGENQAVPPWPESWTCYEGVKC